MCCYCEQFKQEVTEKALTIEQLKTEVPKLYTAHCWCIRGHWGTAALRAARRLLCVMGGKSSQAAGQGPRAAAAWGGERYRLTFDIWRPVKSTVMNLGKNCHWQNHCETAGDASALPAPVSFLFLSPCFLCFKRWGPLPTAGTCGCPAAASRGPSSSGTFSGASQLPLSACCALCVSVCISVCVHHWFAFSPANSHVPLALLTPP